MAHPWPFHIDHLARIILEGDAELVARALGERVREAIQRDQRVRLGDDIGSHGVIALVGAKQEKAEKRTIDLRHGQIFEAAEDVVELELLLAEIGARRNGSDE